jgi:hypothetical protein
MNIPDNPFVLHTYHGEKYFCDRESDLATLQEHIHNGRNVVLFAWRRLGKTALIQRFFDLLEEGREHETIFVDFLACHSIDEAVQAIASSLYDRYGKLETGFSLSFQKLLASIGATLSFSPLTGAPELSVGIRQPDSEPKSLMALGEFLRERKKKIVICLDEFQQIAHFEEAKAEAVFRTWTQHFPDIRFIFSGSHRTMMVEMFASGSRPFYQSAQLLSLKPIPLDRYMDFVQGHFADAGKSISKEQIERIYTWARSQTYTVQLVCNYLYARSIQVEDVDIDQVLVDILEQQQAVFANFPKILTHTQWRVLKAVAKAEPLHNPLRKDFLLKYRLGAASSVSTALKALQKSEMVVVDDGAYLVHEVLLARWLARL